MDNEDEIKDEIEATNEAEKGFSEMAAKEPEREVEAVDQGREEVGTLAKRSDYSPNLSDMQAAMGMAFPSDLGNSVANKVMVGRISPDAFMALWNMMTKNDIAMSDPTKPIDVPEMMVRNYTLLTIGLDGKGRIDLLEIVGAVREAEELSKLGAAM